MTRVLIVNAQSEIFYLQINGANLDIMLMATMLIKVSAYMNAHAILGHVSHPTFFVRHLVQCSCEISCRRNFSSHTVLCGP
jgi:hypothetical protein